MTELNSLDYVKQGNPTIYSYADNQGFRASKRESLIVIACSNASMEISSIAPLNEEPQLKSDIDRMVEWIRVLNSDVTHKSDLMPISISVLPHGQAKPRNWTCSVSGGCDGPAGMAAKDIS